MFGGRVTLFKLFGFAVRVDASWLILAALISWSLAASYFPSHYPGLAVSVYWWMGIATAAGLFGSIVVHEFSHSLVARHYGMQMKGITLFLFGGVAEMGEEPSSAKTEFLMAAAGPATSIVAGAIFYIVSVALKGSLPVPAAAVIEYLAWINWILAAFNLIPAFPLDGGRILRSALWQWRGDLNRATRTAAAMGEGFGALLVLLAVWQLFVGNFIGAMWWFLIGLFLRGAAQASYQQMMVRVNLAGEPVSKFMNVNPVTVPSWLSVEDLVHDFVYRYHYKMFPVLNASERLSGCVSTNQVRAVPRDEWNRHSVQELMKPCSPENTIAPESDAANALTKMSKSGLSRLMVVEEDRLVGVIALKDLLHYMAARLDLEGKNLSSSYHTAHP